MYVYEWLGYKENPWKFSHIYLTTNREGNKQFFFKRYE